jgi:hypothetical protein
LCKVTSRDLATEDYPISDPDAFIESSKITKTGRSKILDWLFTSQKSPKTFYFYPNVASLFETDLSSVYPHFEPTNETYITEVLSEEDIINGMLERDFIIQMPPVKEYTVWVKVKSVEKATLRIVEPEEF